MHPERKPLTAFSTASARRRHSVIVPTRQALDDIPRHVPKQQHLAALCLDVGVGGFAGGEGGEVGVVHWAEGFRADHEEGFFGVHPGFGAVVGDVDGADVGSFVLLVEDHHVVQEAEQVHR